MRVKKASHFLPSRFYSSDRQAVCPSEKLWENPPTEPLAESLPVENPKNVFPPRIPPACPTKYFIRHTSLIILPKRGKLAYIGS
jgi:hypothetical protein